MKNGNKYIKANITSSAYDTNCTCSFLVGGLLGDPLVNMNGKITDANTLFTGYISLANVANRPSDGGMLSIDFGTNRGYQLYFNVFNNRIKGRGYSNDSWTDWADIL